MASPSSVANQPAPIRCVLNCVLGRGKPWIPDWLPSWLPCPGYQVGYQQWIPPPPTSIHTRIPAKGDPLPGAHPLQCNGSGVRCRGTGLEELGLAGAPRLNDTGRLVSSDSYGGGLHSPIVGPIDPIRCRVSQLSSKNRRHSGQCQTRSERAVFFYPVGRVEGYEHCSCPCGYQPETGQWIPSQRGTCP